MDIETSEYSIKEHVSNIKNAEGRKFLKGIYRISEEFRSLIKFFLGSFLTWNFLKTVIPILFLWEIIPRSGLVSRTLFPALSDVLIEFVDLLLHKSLLVHIWSSLSILLASILIAVVIAVPLGIVAGWNQLICKRIMPLLQILSPIPPIAWYPLTIIIFGIGFSMKIFLIFISAFFPIFFNTFQAVKDTDPRYISQARAFGAGEFSLLVNVYFWNALGAILMSIKTGISFGLIMLTASEMYGGRSGIGFLLMTAKEYFQIPVMIVAMMLLGFIGWTFSKIPEYIEVKFSLWKELR